MPHRLIFQATFVALKKGFLLLWIVMGLFEGMSMAQPPTHETVYQYTLDPKPFHPGLCRTWEQGKAIRIRAARHRDLIIHRLPGQRTPKDPMQARSKNYTHFMTIQDLTDGMVTQGAIAFRQNQTAIFTADFPKGLSRTRYLNTLASHQKDQANKALDTFLRLLPILNAAIDTCRPYPPSVSYATDDEIDRIDKGRWSFFHFIHSYNRQPFPQGPLYQYEKGTLGGFFDPEAEKQHTNVSYQALNPLTFFTPGP